MTTFLVVEHLDVIEDIAPRFVAIKVGLAADMLALEQLEMALGDSIVVAVASTAHAGYESSHLYLLLSVGNSLKQKYHSNR